MATLNDGVMSKLSAFSGTANDKISTWLRSLISPTAPATATISDLWLILADQLGYVYGTTQEKISVMMNAALESIAVTGLTTYNDIERAFWNSVADIPIFSYQFDFNTGILTDLPDSMVAIGAVFTRASVKNVLQDGWIVELAVDQFGNSYDSVTGQYGYFPEGAGENLITQSENFTGAPWSWLNATIAPNTITAPNGASTGDTFEESTDGAPAAHYIVAAPATIGVDYAFSCFVEPLGRTQVGLQLGGTITIFNLVDEGSVVSGAGGTIEQINDSWYRCSVVRTAVADANVAIYSTSNGTASYQGDGRTALGIWGAHLEQGLYSTSYIKTTGAAGARAADVLTIPVAGLPEFDDTQYAVITYNRFYYIPPSTSIMMAVYDGTTDNTVLVGATSSSEMNTVVTSGAASQVNITENTFAYDAFTFGASFEDSNFLRSFNGATGTSQASGSMPVGVSQIDIGCAFTVLQPPAFIFSQKLILTAQTQNELNRATL